MWRNYIWVFFWFSVQNSYTISHRNESDDVLVLGPLSRDLNDFKNLKTFLSVERNRFEIFNLGSFSS